MYTLPIAGPSVKNGATHDDLEDWPDANNKCPRVGHLVALVIWPGVDFHWYRKGLNGRWTHKPGGTQQHRGQHLPAQFSGMPSRSRSVGAIFRLSS